MPKQDLHFNSPLTNAPGTLGFYPDFKRVPGLEGLGAFFTNPISRHERKPASDRCLIQYTGGALLHNAYPNPGLRQVIRQYATRWADSPLPVIPHLMIENIFQINEMIEQVESLAGVTAISLRFANGLTDYDVRAWVEQIICEVPVILQVPPARLADMAVLLADTELSGLSMDSQRGCLPDDQNQSTNGRLFGASLFPQTYLYLKQVKKSRLTIIAGGGIYTDEQVQSCLSAGASAVQLDTVLWMGKITHLMAEVIRPA